MEWVTDRCCDWLPGTWTACALILPSSAVGIMRRGAGDSVVTLLTDAALGAVTGPVLALVLPWVGYGIAAFGELRAGTAAVEAPRQPPVAGPPSITAPQRRQVRAARLA